MSTLSFRTPLRLDLPAYYSCYYPLVDLYLSQLTGRSVLGLLPCADLRAVPVFGVNTAGPEPAVFIANASKVFGNDPLVFSLSITAFRSVEMALERVRERIARNEPVLVTGTTYELPHAKDYHNPRFIDLNAHRGMGDNPAGTPQIDDHYLSVIGIGEESVEIYDPVPHNFFGALSLSTFKAFWQGNQQFDVFKNMRGRRSLVPFGIVNVHVADAYLQDDFRATALSVLRTVSELFLEGQVLQENKRCYLAGVALGAWIRDVFSSHYADTGKAPAWLGKCIFDMRFSRYFLRDGLSDAQREFELAPLAWAQDQMTSVIEGWERIYKVFLSSTRRGLQFDPERANSFLALVDDVLAREKALHETLVAGLRGLA